jgi:hypothetical protein
LTCEFFSEDFCAIIENCHSGVFETSFFGAFNLNMITFWSWTACKLRVLGWVSNEVTLILSLRDKDRFNTTGILTIDVQEWKSN